MHIKAVQLSFCLPDQFLAILKLFAALLYKSAASSCFEDLEKKTSQYDHVIIFSWNENVDNKIEQISVALNA